MADYSKMTPPEVWKLIRTGEITRPTAGRICTGKSGYPAEEVRR